MWRMTTPEQDREEEALDALIVAAFRNGQGKEDDELDLTGPEPRLSEADERALAALGPDVVGKVLAGGHASRSTKVSRTDPAREPDLELTGAMNRAEEGAEISQEAREEMERKIREHEEETGEEAAS